MSLSDLNSADNENPNESKDRSLSEWNFSNPKKYLIDQRNDKALDVNDVQFELFRSENLPYKYEYAGNNFDKCEFQNKGKLKIKTVTDDGNVLSTAQDDKNLYIGSFLSSASDSLSKENVPIHNSHRSYITESNDQKTMNKPVSKSNSSHTFNPGITENDCTFSSSWNSFNKNVPLQLESENINNICLSAMEGKAATKSESSQGMKFHYFNEGTRNKNSDMALLHISGTESQKMQGIRKCYSTLNLKDPDITAKPPVSQTSSQSPMSKSYSLNNLASFKTLNYDHIQSKVKRYIQERKRQELKARRHSKSSESKSLPVTPVKNKTDNSDNKGLLILDEDYLEYLRISSKKQREDLPEDLKQLKQEILNGNADSNLVETLFNRLKLERECRIDKDITLNALQLHYDSLLTKYAQAKDIIDNLRFHKDIHIEKKEDLLDDPNKYPNFKKAYSTSNIFTECSSADGNLKPFSNLVRYSSSPLVDPDLAFREIENIEDEEKPLNENLLNKRSSSTFTIDTSFQNDFSEWFEKCEFLNQKLKEYIILQANSALNKEERDKIWNFIMKIFSKLQSEYHSFDQCSTKENDCKTKLEELSEVIEDLSHKYSSEFPTSKYHHGKDEKYFPASSAENTNLPSNSSYPNIAFRGLVDSHLDSSSKHIVPTQLTTQTIEKPKPSFLKYSGHRDADSGCPPSDRSTRNSQFPSFEQSEPLLNVVTGSEGASNPGFAFRKTMYDSKRRDPLRRKSIDSFLNLSSINLGIDENPRRRMYNRKDYRYRSLYTFDEDYDASGSSELEDSFEDERSKKYVRKRLSKSNRTPALNINKFEDKFICNHRTRTTDSRSSKYEINKHMLGMSQMEKNSKYFEVQVKDLKLKGLLRKRVDKKRYSLPNRPNTPLRALTKDMSLVHMSTVSFSSTPKTPKNHMGLEKSQNGTINNSCTNLTHLNSSDRLERESNSCIHCSFPVETVPLCRCRKFSTSTPKSRDSEKTMCDSGVFKEPISASASCIGNDRSKFSTRSVSVPSLYDADQMEATTPMDVNTSGYAQHHSCQIESRDICCCSRPCLAQESVYLHPGCEKNNTSNATFGNDYPRLLAFLNEATEMAKAARNQTKSGLTLLRTNITPSSRR